VSSLHRKPEERSKSSTKGQELSDAKMKLVVKTSTDDRAGDCRWSAGLMIGVSWRRGDEGKLLVEDDTLVLIGVPGI
jgi:hypothetical protein